MSGHDPYEGDLRYQDITADLKGFENAVSALEVDMKNHNLVRPVGDWTWDQKKSSWYQWDLNKQCFKYHGGGQFRLNGQGDFVDA